MSSKSRLGLIALAIAVAVVAFVVLNPGGTDEDQDDPGTNAAQTTPESTTSTKTPTATAPSAPTPAADEIAVKGGKPVDGVAKLKLKKGDTLRLIVTSDQKYEIHLHGYDVMKDAGPGEPARFKVKTDVEGVFEIEVEDTGEKIADLTVEPA